MHLLFNVLHFGQCLNLHTLWIWFLNRSKFSLDPTSKPFHVIDLFSDWARQRNPKDRFRDLYRSMHHGLRIASSAGLLPLVRRILRSHFCRIKKWFDPFLYFQYSNSTPLKWNQTISSLEKNKTPFRWRFAFWGKNDTSWNPVSCKEQNLRKFA